MSNEDGGRKYGPLSELWRAWEAKKQKEFGLEDVDWDPAEDCEWCRAKDDDSDEPPVSGVAPAIPPWLLKPLRGHRR